MTTGRNSNATSGDERPAIPFSRFIEEADREQIQAIKLRKLQRLVEYLYERNGFYRSRMKAAGVDPSQIASLEDLVRIPAVTKEEFVEDQNTHPPFGTRLGVPEEKVAVVHVTSGTSGKGQEVYGLTRADYQLELESSMTMWMWAGLKADEIGSSMVAVTNSAAGVSMRPAIAMVGRYPVHVGHLPYGERLDWFRKFGVHAIYGMPSYLNTLTGLCEERGWDPKEAFPELRFFLLAGESYPIGWAERMIETWGIELHETYGSTQTGGTCSAATDRRGVLHDGARGRLHLFEWTVLYEVLNPVTLEPTEPGEEGELYVTTLDREASPTLRFASRDRARWFPWDHDGPGGLPLDSLEAGTIGRYDDMLKIKGVNVWPSAVDEVMFSHPAIDEYQATVTVNGRGRTEVVMATALRDTVAHSDSDAILSELAASLKDRIGISFRFEPVTRDDLPDFEFKARRWIDNRDAAMSLEPEVRP